MSIEEGRATRRSAPETKSGFRLSRGIARWSRPASSRVRIEDCGRRRGRLAKSAIKYRTTRGDRDRIAPSLAWFCRRRRSFVCRKSLMFCTHNWAGNFLNLWLHRLSVCRESLILKRRWFSDAFSDQLDAERSCSPDYAGIWRHAC